MGIFDKFKLGLSKSSKSFSSGLNSFIFKRKIDESMLNELEDFLIQSDVGVESAKELRENPDVKEFYLGMSEEGRKSYRDVRSYRRRKRWLN